MPIRLLQKIKLCWSILATGTSADDVTTLLGTFLVQKIIAAAFRQAAVPENLRNRHVLIVDEFQRFMHRAASFDQILAEARKYKLSLVVANQFVEQLAHPCTGGFIWERWWTYCVSGRGTVIPVY